MNPNPQLQNLRNRIHGKRTGSGNTSLEDKDYIAIQHKLMKHYGWIPLDEYKKIPIPTVFNLLHYCNKEEENEYHKFRLLIKAITGKDIGKN